MQAIPPNRLARICAYSTDAGEWTQFVSQITPVVALAARRVSAVWGDPSNSTVSEVIQEFFLKLCEDDRKVLREFEDRGNDSFLKLVRVITSSIATDYFRRQQAEKRGGRTVKIPLETQQPMEEVSLKTDTEAIERATLIAQLDGMLLKNSQRITSRDRSLFWLYYRQGLTAEAISRIPAIGLSSKGVESALSRITHLLREAILNDRSIPGNSEQITHSAIQSKRFASVVAIDMMKPR